MTKKNFQWKKMLLAVLVFTAAFCLLAAPVSAADVNSVNDLETGVSTATGTNTFTLTDAFAADVLVQGRAVELDIPDGVDITIDGSQLSAPFESAELASHFSLTNTSEISGTTTVTFSDISFTGNNSGGGGIIDDDLPFGATMPLTVGIVDCTFGGITFGNPIEISPTDLEITDSAFTNNEYVTGVVFLPNNQTNVTIIDSSFTENIGGFPVINSNGNNITIEGSSFIGNSDFGYSSTSTFTVIGVKVFQESDVDKFIVSITDSIFENNAGTHTNGQYHGGVLDFAYLAFYDISNTSFTGNTLTEDAMMAVGGVLYAEDSPGTITNSTFAENSALEGGAVWIIGGSLDIFNSAFIDNEGNLNQMEEPSSGGAIKAVDAEYLHITDSYFRGNKDLHGGAVMVDTLGVGGFTVSGSTFEGNGYEGATGGAIAANNTNPIYISNSTFFNNTAERYSVISLEKGSGGSMYGVTIVNNTAGGSSAAAPGTFEIIANSIISGNSPMNMDEPYTDTSGNVIGESLIDIFGTETPQLITIGEKKAGTLSELYNITTLIPRPEGAASGAGLGGELDFDQNGNLHHATYPDSGAVDMRFIKYDANGGVWNSTADARFENNITNNAAEFFLTTENTSYYELHPVSTDTLINTTLVPAHDSLTFLGWVDAATDGSPISGLTWADNVTVYANWSTPEPVKVIYFINNGTDFNVSEDYVTPYTVKSFTELGFTFDENNYTVYNNWTNSTGTLLHEFGASLTEPRTTNLELYANVTPKNFTLTYNSTGATSGDDIPVPDLPYNSVYTLDNNQTIVNDSGYFAGWSTLPNGEGTSYGAGSDITILGDIILYPKWSAEEQITVEYRNSDFGQTWTESVSIDAEYTFRGLTDANLSIFTVPDGKEFDYWQDLEAEPDATDTYDAGETITFTDYQKGMGIIYVETVWKDVVTTIFVITYENSEYDEDWPEIISASETNYIVKGLTDLSFTTPPGKTFDYWQEAELSERFNAGASINISDYYAEGYESLTLVTVWQNPIYNNGPDDGILVRFETNGGTPTPPDQVFAGSGIVDEPSSMTKSGSTFTGWYTNSGLTTQWNFGDATTQSMTLYAGWESPVTTTSPTPSPTPTTVPSQPTGTGDNGNGDGSGDGNGDGSGDGSGDGGSDSPFNLFTGGLLLLAILIIVFGVFLGYKLWQAYQERKGNRPPQNPEI